MLRLQDAAADLCKFCSNDGSVFRKDFDDARYGVENKQTISMTPAPDVGRPFNM